MGTFGGHSPCSYMTDTLDICRCSPRAPLFSHIFHALPRWIENSSYKSSLNRKFRQNEVILHFLLRTTSSCIKIVKKRSFLLSLIFSRTIDMGKTRGEKIAKRIDLFSCFCQDFWVTWLKNLGQHTMGWLATSTT